MYLHTYIGSTYGNYCVREVCVGGIWKVLSISIGSTYEHHYIYSIYVHTYMHSVHMYISVV